MNAFYDFTPLMSEALRAVGSGAATIAEIGPKSSHAVRTLCDRGFLFADRDGSPVFYTPTPMGLGALAVLNAPFVPKPGSGPVERIKEIVALYYKIPSIEMVSARRSRHVARPRQIAMFLAREMTPMSFPELGRRFGNRDHTTVMHAVQKIAALESEDPMFADEIEHIRRMLEPHRSAAAFDEEPTDRTPCFKCGARADIGCKHSLVAA